MKIRCLTFITFFTCYLCSAQTADFTFTTSSGVFCSPQAVTFTQTSTGSPVAFIWNFGNGQSGNNASQTITYNNAGTYNVTLSVVYDNTVLNVTKTLNINPVPTVSLSADRVSLCQPGVVNFNASPSGNISGFEWDFGDGSPIQTTGTNTISHNFITYNSFNVSVKAITPNGCNSSASILIQVAKLALSGTVNPSSGCIPVNSLLTINSAFPAGDGLKSITWNFGDGSPNVTGSSNTINHLYNTTAVINNANIFITSNQGCTNQYTFNQFAYGIPPSGTNAFAVAARDTFCGSETIQFHGKALNANYYTWDFGDGTSASTNDTLITHKYISLGSKTVIVTPDFNGCGGTKATVNIFIKGVIANFNFSNTCATKNLYSFSNFSLGNISHYEWSYSDVNALRDSVNLNPSHLFPANGTYITKLFIVDNVTGCRDSLSANIYVASPSLKNNKTSVCKDSLIIYDVANAYPPGSAHSYEFHVNTGVYNAGAVDSVGLYPSVHGLFNDYVVILDTLPSTCNDTLYVSQGIKVTGPVAGFTSPVQICADSSVVIVNKSFPFFSTDPITKWSWDFGDNKKDSVQNPAPHTYASSGTYNLQLIATDINGCGQKVINPVIINPTPRLNIFPSIDTLCRNDSAILKAYTTDSLSWTPNTNISCINCDTVSVYPTVTTSYIAKAMNAFGCKSYDTSLIKVYNPFKLTVSPSDTSVCAGTPVQLKLNTIGKTIWSPPTFLNNAAISNPVSVPDTNITYKITVQDSVGCFSDSAIAVINVYSKPAVNAGPDRVLAFSTPFTLNPAYSSNITSYLWTPAGTLSCTNCPFPNAIASQKETYQIKVMDVNGCKAADSVTIFITCEKSNLRLPNAFTPNRDGLNDYFYPNASGYSIIKSFVIFNRWGTRVFERSDFQPNIPSLGWNGSYKGQSNFSTQSFVWIIEGVCDSGDTITTRGSVIWIR